MTTPAVPESLRSAPTSVVSDALDEHVPDADRAPGDDGAPPAVGGGVLDGLPPAHPDHRTAGRARPIAFERVAGDEPTNFPFALLEAPTAGEVVVIDGVPHVSSWGALACRLAAAAGVEGLVVARGGYRDAPEVRAGSFPVFGGTRTPHSGKRRVRVATTDAPVTVDGTTVAPGDVVVADATGVVVVPRAVEDAVAATAADLLEEEDRMEAAIDGGATVGDLREDGLEF